MSVFRFFIISNFRHLFATDHVGISEDTEESIDQVAVLTSNILFFIVMFIFAVFETYVVVSCF